MKTTTIAVINGHTIQVSNDEQQLVPIKPICQALGIDDRAQRQKISEDDFLSSTGVLSTLVDADGNFLYIPSMYARFPVVAPTQAEAMRWLREYHHLSVRVNFIKAAYKNWFWDILNTETEDYFDGDGFYPTYEAAAEAGIQAACEYLIEKGGEG